jgi:hypothetical protein
MSNELSRILRPHCRGVVCYRHVGVVGEHPIHAEAIVKPELSGKVTWRLHVDRARWIALAEVLR